MVFINVRNPVWQDEEHTQINLTYDVEGGETGLTYTTSSSDIEPRSLALFAAAVAGSFGEIAPVPQERLDLAATTTAGLAERTAQKALATDLKADSVFDALRTATPAQISTFVNNNFGAFNATQKAVMKMLIQVAALSIRKM